LLVINLYSSADRPYWSNVRLFSLGFTLFSLLLGCGSGDGGGIHITGSGANESDGSQLPGSGSPNSGGAGASNPTVSVSLAWNPVPDSSVHGYFVYYGKQSAGQAGSCNYTNSAFVGSSSATITGLEPDTLYYFAVSAYNGLHSDCSNEVSTITQAAA